MQIKFHIIPTSNKGRVNITKSSQEDIRGCYISSNMQISRFQNYTHIHNSIFEKYEQVNILKRELT